MNLKIVSKTVADPKDSMKIIFVFLTFSLLTAGCRAQKTNTSNVKLAKVYWHFYADNDRPNWIVYDELFLKKIAYGFSHLRGPCPDITYQNSVNSEYGGFTVLFLVKRPNLPVSMDVNIVNNLGVIVVKSDNETKCFIEGERASMFSYLLQSAEANGHSYDEFKHPLGSTLQTDNLQPRILVVINDITNQSHPVQRARFEIYGKSQVDDLINKIETSPTIHSDHMNNFDKLDVLIQISSGDVHYFISAKEGRLIILSQPNTNAKVDGNHIHQQYVNYALEKGYLTLNNSSNKKNNK